MGSGGSSGSGCGAWSIRPPERAGDTIATFVGCEAAMPQIGLIIVGDEILSGKRTDKHLVRVIEILSARGLRLRWAQYVGDDRAAITGVLRRTFGGDDIVFSCGGIGATPDDHTRQAAAAALGVDIELHPQAAELIAQRCAEMAAEGRGSADMSTPENRQRLKMGEFPRGARIIPNPFNRIPGFAVGRHHFLPGFPAMAWPMIEAVLDQEYAALFGSDRIAERSMIVFETAESLVTPVMEEVEARFAGVLAFSLPSVGDGRDGRVRRRHIELGVKGDPARIDAAFESMRRGIEKLGAPFELT
jgi:molybdopterin-biosynthesis enzyme MoeA-like protein